MCGLCRVCVCVVSVTQKPHRCRRGRSRPAEGSARPCSPPPVAQATRAHTPTSAAHPFTRVGTGGGVEVRERECVCVRVCVRVLVPLSFLSHAANTHTHTNTGTKVASHSLVVEGVVRVLHEANGDCDVDRQWQELQFATALWNTRARRCGSVGNQRGRGRGQAVESLIGGPHSCCACRCMYVCVCACE